MGNERGGRVGPDELRLVEPVQESEIAPATVQLLTK